MALDKVNLSQKFDSINSFWDPKIIGGLNGQHVKIAKIKGDFVMHSHEHEDELFLVIVGRLFIEFKDNTVELAPGEMIIVPKGVEHRPFAHEETHILMFEPESTLNTGNVLNEFTQENLERI